MYFAIDFGNSNTNIAVLDLDKKPLKPELLESDEIGFHYQPNGKKFLMPSSIAQQNDKYVIGAKAKNIDSSLINLKDELRKESLNLAKPVICKPGSKEMPIIDVCAAYFRELFQSQFKQRPLKFTPTDIVALTIPSFDKQEDRDNYVRCIRDILKKAIDNFAELENIFEFPDEALATAVGHRVFQSAEGFQRDILHIKSKDGLHRTILCMDIGSFSADVRYFETDSFYEVQQDKAPKTECFNTQLAGTDIDKWIQNHLKNARPLKQCERIKLDLSMKKTLDPTININENVLDNILNNNGFYDKLAQLCFKALPDDAGKDKNYLNTLYFLFTGGTSLLPGFRESLVRKLWKILYQKDITKDELDNLLSDLRINSDETPDMAFDACVKGALWWLYLKKNDKRFIPTSASDYALMLYEKDSANNPTPKFITFLAEGEDITKGFEKQVKLIPFRDNEARYRIPIIRTDDSGQRAVYQIQDELRGRKEITLTLKVNNNGELTTVVDGQQTRLFHV